VGRCLDLVYGYFHPIRDVKDDINCTLIWWSFQQAFMGKNPLTIATSDFAPYFQAASHPVPRTMFWTGSDKLAYDPDGGIDDNSTTFYDLDLVHELSDGGQHFWTLEDTMWGYLLNGLNFCGADVDQQGSTLFNYTYCPSFGSPGSVIIFWNAASQFFASLAKGPVWMVARASIRNNQPYLIYRTTALGNTNTSAGIFPSIFATYELPNVNAALVTSFNLWVVVNDQVPTEMCGSGSVVPLVNALVTAGIPSPLINCVNNPPVAQFLRCANSLASEAEDPTLACDFDPNNPYIVSTQRSALGPGGSVAALVIMMCLIVGGGAFAGGWFLSRRRSSPSLNDSSSTSEPHPSGRKTGASVLNVDT